MGAHISGKRATGSSRLLDCRGPGAVERAHFSVAMSQRPGTFAG
jgi:hypothetical protein